MALENGIQDRGFGSKFNCLTLHIRKIACICLALCAVGIILSTKTLGSWKSYPQRAIAASITRKAPAPAISNILFWNVTASTDPPHLSLPTANTSSIMDILTDTVARVPSKPLEDVFTYVTDLLRQQWNHTRNGERFKLIFQEKVKMSTYDNLVITRKNTPLGSKISTLYKQKIKADSAVFKWFPEEPPLPQPPYTTCSVVGSSGILLGSQCGNEIDRADIVFRFNLAPTWTFETDVGGKTHMTTMNPSIMKLMYGGLKNASGVDSYARMMSKQNGIIWSPAFAYPGNQPISMKAIEKGHMANANLTFVFENVDHYKAVTRFWREYDYVGAKNWPSTGFYIISSALTLCTNVNVYGFWPFRLSSDGEPVKYHYYDDIDGRLKHDMSTEFRTIVSMHQLGLLTLHVGNCTDNVL